MCSPTSIGPNLLLNVVVTTFAFEEVVIVVVGCAVKFDLMTGDWNGGMHVPSMQIPLLFLIGVFKSTTLYVLHCAILYCIDLAQPWANSIVKL